MKGAADDLHTLPAEIFKKELARKHFSDGGSGAGGAGSGAAGNSQGRRLPNVKTFTVRAWHAPSPPS